MINLFIGSNSNAAMGGTFVIDSNEKLANSRLTALEDCVPVSTAITTKTTGKASSVEHSRVNALAVLLRELKMLESTNTTEIITCYLPDVLLTELNSGRVRYYLQSNTNTFFSVEEIALWNELLPIMQKMFMQLVFKDIRNARGSKFNNDRIQMRRASIYKGIVDAIKISEEAFAQ